MTNHRIAPSLQFAMPIDDLTPVELDPTYCDVICTRYQQLTRNTPIHTNTPHNFTTNAS